MPAPVRYAVRQVLAQELAREKLQQASLARQARVQAPSSTTDNTLNDDDNDDTDEANKENHPQQQQQQRISAKELIASKSKDLSLTMGGKFTSVKKDFFGRPILQPCVSQANIGMGSLNQGGVKPLRAAHARQQSSAAAAAEISEDQNAGQRTWVSFHEGYSNAVRKYISLNEFLDGF